MGRGRRAPDARCGHLAVLVTRDGERYEASDPDTLVALITGRAIPVSGLEYWVRGMARPGAGFDLRADTGRPCLPG
jgi:outer membrane lipoprotein LolB